MEIIHLCPVPQTYCQCLWLWPYMIVLCVAIVTYDVLLQTPVIHALGVVLQDEELYPEPTKYDSR